jgi:hypothetical protein
LGRGGVDLRDVWALEGDDVDELDDVGMRRWWRWWRWVALGS